MTDTQNLTEKDITEKQRMAIPIILQGTSIADGCRKAGVSREAFYCWLRIPDFKSEFTRQRGAVIDEALHSLKASLGDAVDTLKRLLKAKGSKGEGTRLKASLAIIENTLKSVENEELTKRIEALERKGVKRNGWH